MASQPPKEEPMDWYESVYEVDMDVVHQPPTTSEYKVMQNYRSGDPKESWH